jgi:protein TonB
MFEDSLLESAGRLKTGRRRTTAVSFALESGLVGALVLVPLIFTQALPKARLNITVVPPPPAAARPAPPSPVTHTRPQTNYVDALVPPVRIPHGIAHVVDQPGSPEETASVGVPNGVGSGNATGVLHSILAAAAMPPPTPSIPRAPVRVSTGVMNGYIVHQVQPVYPPIAKTAGIEGPVLLQATISRTGAIENLRVLSGHPMLVKSALDAVRQWRYRPYLLNNEPVEVETQVTVNFTLHR